MASFVCVLKGGGRYSPEWVARLHHGVSRHAPGFTRFLCLSDCDFAIDGVERVPLVRDWPAWWAKMETFRPGLTRGTTLLCDLDTVFVAPAPQLAEPGAAAMEDYFLKGRLSSALMRWESDAFGFLFTEFDREPERWMQPGSCGPVPNSVHGDQVVVDHMLRRRGLLPPFLQARYSELLDFYDPRKPIRGPVVVFIGNSKPDNASKELQGHWRMPRPER